MTYVTLAEASKRLGLSPQRLRALSPTVLRAEKIAGRWVVTEKELARFAALTRRPPGWARKTS